MEVIENKAEDKYKTQEQNTRDTLKHQVMTDSDSKTKRPKINASCVHAEFKPARMRHATTSVCNHCVWWWGAWEGYNQPQVSPQDTSSSSLWVILFYFIICIINDINNFRNWQGKCSKAEGVCGSGTENIPSRGHFSWPDAWPSYICPLLTEVKGRNCRRCSCNSWCQSKARALP